MSFSADWIKRIPTRKHWELLWMQQNMMDPFITEDMQLLELGVGNKFTYNYLKSRGFAIDSIDIDLEKDPDYHSDILDWTPEKKYDGFLAFQVFEHMPFDNVRKVVKMLAENNFTYLFISVPDNSISKAKYFEGRIRLPILKDVQTRLCLPPFLPVKSRHEHHCWELNDAKVNKKKYYNMFSDGGYERIGHEKLYYAHFDTFRLR